MSHYDEGRERYYDEMAQHLRGQQGAAKPASSLSIPDLLAMLVAGVERIVTTLDRIAATHGDPLPLDMTDAQQSAPAENLQTDLADALAAQIFTEDDRLELIYSLNHLCWPQCAVSRNPGDRTVTLRFPNTIAALDHVANLLNIRAGRLRAILASFPSYGASATQIAITFPQRWALSA